jgi:hypothetical protein
MTFDCHLRNQLSVSTEERSEGGREGGREGRRESAEWGREGGGAREYVCMWEGKRTLVKDLVGLDYCCSGVAEDDHGWRRQVGDDHALLEVGHGLDVYLALLPF